MIDEAMSPCFRGCGAWVKTNESAICGACQVGPKPDDPRLRTTWHRCGPFKIHTVGYSVRLESLVPAHSLSLFSWEARALAAAISKAADFVEALKSPYTNESNPTGDPP